MSGRPIKRTLRDVVHRDAVLGEAVPTLRHASRLLHFRVTVNIRHQLLLPRPHLVLTKPLRLDIQCQRGASVKIGWKYLDD